MQACGGATITWMSCNQRGAVPNVLDDLFQQLVDDKRKCPIWHTIDLHFSDIGSVVDNVIIIASVESLQIPADAKVVDVNLAKLDMTVCLLDLPMVRDDDTSSDIIEYLTVDYSYRLRQTVSSQLSAPVSSQGPGFLDRLTQVIVIDYGGVRTERCWM
jgi:hypothetical protein